MRQVAGAGGMNDAAAIVIQLEGRPHGVPPGCTLAALIASLGHSAPTVAAAVNDQFVPRERRDAFVLSPGDAVLLFQPIVGG
jgi:sulfur carrier protein